MTPQNFAKGKLMTSMPDKGVSQKWTDLWAIGVSGVCLLHCLALPFFIASVPLLGGLSDQEWVHKGLVFVAFPLSLWALMRVVGWLNGVRFLLFVLGLGLLATAAFWPPVADYETILSVVGACLLALMHTLNLLAHKH